MLAHQSAARVPYPAWKTPLRSRPITQSIFFLESRPGMFLSSSTSMGPIILGLVPKANSTIQPVPGRGYPGYWISLVSSTDSRHMSP